MALAFNAAHLQRRIDHLDAQFLHVVGPKSAELKFNTETKVYEEPDEIELPLNLIPGKDVKDRDEILKKFSDNEEKTTTLNEPFESSNVKSEPEVTTEVPQAQPQDRKLEHPQNTSTKTTTTTADKHTSTIAITATPIEEEDWHIVDDMVDFENDTVLVL